MGAHWLDITSPELNQENPKSFTQTFIYGSYDGKVIFMEPMITKAFMDSTSQFERANTSTGQVPKNRLLSHKNEDPEK